MAAIKLTPFLLFLLLLLVLVVSVVLGSFAKIEGFTSFAQSTPSLQMVTIPQYSNSNQVHKLYDNIFFDNKNSNLIEVDSPAYAGNADVTGSSITSCYVSSRDGALSVYQTQMQGNAVVGQLSDKSSIPSISSAYKQWTYPTQSKTTDKYTVCYMPWMTDTYLHIINNTTKTNVETVMFSGSQATNTIANTPVGITGYVVDNDANNGKMVTENFYDPSKNVFQMSKYVKFDMSNANLIVQKGDGSSKSITVYDRYGNTTLVANANQIPSTSSSIVNLNFKPFSVVDACGQNMILYIQKGQNTMVSMINYTDGTLSTFNLANVYRFNANGMDTGSQAQAQDATSSANASTTVNLGTPASAMQGNATITPDNTISEYYNFYKFWKIMNGAPKGDGTSEDYLLKTQIVPPVCPSCPACPNCTGTCTSCGGQGGSGTLSVTGSSLVNPNNPALINGNAIAAPGTQTSNYVPNANNLGIVSSVGSAAGNTVDATGNVLNKTIGIAGTAAGSTVDIAGNVINKSIGAVGGIANTAIGTTANVLQTAESGVASLLPKFTLPNVGSGATVSGASQGLSQGPVQIQGQPQVVRDQKGLRDQLSVDQTKSLQGPGYMGTAAIGSDSYAYFGALPSKSGNFMPITTSFSAFGK